MENLRKILKEKNITIKQEFISSSEFSDIKKTNIDIYFIRNQTEEMESLIAIRKNMATKRERFPWYFNILSLLTTYIYYNLLGKFFLVFKLQSFLYRVLFLWLLIHGMILIFKNTKKIIKKYYERVIDKKIRNLNNAISCLNTENYKQNMHKAILWAEKEASKEYLIKFYQLVGKLIGDYAKLQEISNIAKHEYTQINNWKKNRMVSKIFENEFLILKKMELMLTDIKEISKNIKEYNSLIKTFELNDELIEFNGEIADKKSGVLYEAHTNVINTLLLIQTGLNTDVEYQLYRQQGLMNQQYKKSQEELAKQFELKFNEMKKINQALEVQLANQKSNAAILNQQLEKQIAETKANKDVILDLQYEVEKIADFYENRKNYY